MSKFEVEWTEPWDQLSTNPGNAKKELVKQGYLEDVTNLEGDVMIVINVTFIQEITDAVLQSLETNQSFN